MKTRRTLTEWYEDTLDYWHAWRAWHNAVTYNDLTAINANELAGRFERNRTSILASQASQQMLTALIELNRCGIFTTVAQPGGINTRPLGDPVEHRAAVSMILSDQMWNGWLEDAIDEQYDRDFDSYELSVFNLLNPDHTVYERRACRAAIKGVPVTRVGSEEKGWEYVGYQGAQATAAEIQRAWPAKPDALGQLYSGWQVTIADPNYGESTLFDHLLQVAKRYQASRKNLDGMRPEMLSA